MEVVARKRRAATATGPAVWERGADRQSDSGPVEGNSRGIGRNGPTTPRVGTRSRQVGTRSRRSGRAVSGGPARRQGRDPADTAQERSEGRRSQLWSPSGTAGEQRCQPIGESSEPHVERPPSKPSGGERWWAARESALGQAGRRPKRRRSETAVRRRRYTCLAQGEAENVRTRAGRRESRRGRRRLATGDHGRGSLQRQVGGRRAGTPGRRAGRPGEVSCRAGPQREHRGRSAAYGTPPPRARRWR